MTEWQYLLLFLYMVKGERIRARREQLGMTQKELAEKLGFSNYASIWKIEKGERNLPANRIQAAAAALDTTVDYLFGITDNPDPVKPQAFKTPEEFEKARAAAAENKGTQHKVTYKADGTVQHEIIGFDDKLVRAYHAAPEKDQKTVRLVLDIDENGDKQ